MKSATELAREKMNEDSKSRGKRLRQEELQLLKEAFADLEKNIQGLLQKNSELHWPARVELIRNLRETQTQVMLAHSEWAVMMKEAGDFDGD